MVFSHQISHYNFLENQHLKRNRYTVSYKVSYKEPITDYNYIVFRQIEAITAHEGPRPGEPAAAGTESAADRRHALGWTALMAAAANDQPTAVRELLKLGAKPDLQERSALLLLHTSQLDKTFQALFMLRSWNTAAYLWGIQSHIVL